MLDFTEIDCAFDRAEADQSGKSLWERVKDVKFPYIDFVRNKVKGLDPFSLEYLKAMEEIHQAVIETDSRKRYSFQCEGNKGFDAEWASTWGWPWMTMESPTIVRYLRGYIEVLVELPVKRNASILEPGCGLGGVTEFLVRCGFAVDAVDVSEESCNVVRNRLKLYPTNSNVICSDLESHLNQCGKQYDAVVFDSSFHHLMHHYRILEKIVNEHLEEDGKIILAQEPIWDDSWGDALPYPWGLRFDGESLYRFRKDGWLELGFKKSYIEALCKKLGLFMVEKRVKDNSDMYVLSRRKL